MTKLSFPPGPKGIPLVGSFLDFQRDTPAFLLQVAREYGDIVHFMVGPLHMFLLNHPDYIEEVLRTRDQRFIKAGMTRAKHLLGAGLLVSEGDHHDRQRRLVCPTLHQQCLAACGATITGFGKQLRAGWHKGATVNISQEMMGLTVKIVGHALLGDVAASDLEAAGKDLEAGLDWINSYPETMAFLDMLPLPHNRQFKRARARLDTMIHRAIGERRARGATGDDLLALLLHARDQDGSRMTDEQARDEALTLFIAGHEPTAMALTWTWYLLSEHPAVEAALHRELETVLDGRLPTVHDLPQLRYTEMIVLEAMRRYPPIWIFARQPLADDTIGGYRVPAGSFVFVCQYVTHHDPRFYSDPFRFDPQRWTPEAMSARPAGTYFPFGRGPRTCLGEQFARMECMLLLATLAQRWKLRHIPGRYPVALRPTFTLRPKHPLAMRLELRG